MIFLYILAALLILFIIWALLVTGRGRHSLWPELMKYRYAHRGYHDKPTVPENSMAAFRRAAARGWGAELDIHLMKDGNLAVIHDSSLKRTAGANVFIEDLTAADLDAYRLEESDEKIPLFEEVLELFHDKTPLIIELKAERGNAAALSAAAYERLKNYEGLFCIESFDPRVVKWFRKNAPDIVRGQLATRMKGKKKKLLNFMLTHVLLNAMGRPDFIAYNWNERKKTLSIGLSKALWGTREFAWTIRDKETLQAAEAIGVGVIFEKFNPET